MAYKVLYRKYRPDNFENLVGQEYTVEMLKNSIKNDKISHAYIFTGPRGTGKTSTAKIFAKAINCLNPNNGEPCNKCEHCMSFQDNPDIIEIDAASNNGVDEIRELINNVKLSPTTYKYKVYIIDEVHMLSTSAFNALLLTLEEPPSHVVFILATTDIQNVPITILSRCQRFDFRRIETSTIVRRLEHVCKQENIAIQKEALEEIAILCEGGLRDALGMLDQLATSISREIILDDVISHFGTVSTKAIDELTQYIEDNDVENLLQKLADFKNSSLDYKVIVFKLMKALENLAIQLKVKKINSRLEFEEIKKLIFELNDIISEAKLNMDPYILIEMVLLGYMNPMVSKNKTSEKLPPKEEKIEIVEEIQQEVVEDNHQEIEKEEPKIPEKSKKVETKEIQKIDILISGQKPIITQSWVSIRVNNSFCDAQKPLLANLKNKWNAFLDYVKDANASFYGIIIDAEPVVASSNCVLLDGKTETNTELINEKVILFEAMMKEFFQEDYHIVAVSHDRWTNEKKTYIDSLKSGKTYAVQEDEKLQYESEEAQEELESIANEIFSDSVAIEIE